MKRAWWSLPLGVAWLAACAGRPPEPPVPRPTAAPAPPPAAASATLDEMLRSDVASHRGLAWSSARPLRWSDFQGIPRQGGDEAAKTAYGIYYAWKCRGRTFEFRAVAAFHLQESWVQAAVVQNIAEGPRTLGHEQTHFNIAEVYARRMRRHFRELAEPCAKSDAALTADAERILDEEKATQRRYDKETAHGLRGREQAAWEAEIGGQLELLRRYREGS